MSGNRSYCKPCYNARVYAARRKKIAAMPPKDRAKLRELGRKRMAEWRAGNREHSRKYAVTWRKKLIAEMAPDELAAFRKAERDKTKRLNAALKNEVFEAYGGWKCNCCGETERSFLSIDHMQNNGSKLRREGVHGHSTQFYRWLKKSGFPSDFQVLCMNCQFGKRMNRGVCPHQVRCNDYPQVGVGPSGPKRIAP